MNWEKSGSATQAYIPKIQFFIFILNWEELRSPARATFKNPKISWLIGKNLQRKTNTKNPNFESMDELGKFDLSFTVENKVGNFHKRRLFSFISNLTYNE